MKEFASSTAFLCKYTFTEKRGRALRKGYFKSASLLKNYTACVIFTQPIIALLRIKIKCLYLHFQTIINRNKYVLLL